MKTHLYILIIIVLLTSSCKDKGKGTVLYKINFTTNDITSKSNMSLKSAKLTDSGYYTQFGDYITSLTPQKFVAQMWTMGYIDKVLNRNTGNANILQYINQNLEVLDVNDPSRYIDFSDNNVVTFNPEISRPGSSKDPKINFNYFYFIPFGLYQEVELPEQYKNVFIEMFGVTVPEDNVLQIEGSFSNSNCNTNKMLEKIFPSAKIGNGPYDCLFFIFGNTDSTYVVNPNGETVGNSDIIFTEDCPIAYPKQNLVIRSNKYDLMTFTPPSDGETVVMYGTVSFNTDGLIQVYAGKDNIPYTSDDIFVYAPYFWERICAKLDIE